jgi:hypothetical protein
MKNAVPTLSTQGWVVDLPTQINTLLAYALTTDDKQSYLFKGSLISVPRIMQKTGMDARSARAALETSLSSYLQKYFDNVYLVVTIVNEDTDLSSTATLKVDIQVNNNNDTDTRSYAINLNEGRFGTIMRLNNDGA